MTVQRTRLRQLLEDLRGTDEPSSPAMGQGQPPTQAEIEWIIASSAMADDEVHQLIVALENNSEEIGQRVPPLPPDVSRKHLAGVLRVMLSARTPAIEGRPYIEPSADVPRGG
jgi:hypothetical protein